jgi:hypothetical protein
MLTAVVIGLLCHSPPHSAIVNGLCFLAVLWSVVSGRVLSGRKWYVMFLFSFISVSFGAASYTIVAITLIFYWYVFGCHGFSTGHCLLKERHCWLAMQQQSLFNSR